MSDLSLREYHDNISDSLYNAIPQRISIKDTVLEYIDPLSNLTISGVTYKIWLNMTNGMPEIARIANNKTLAKDIREAYYGGIAEVLVPTVGYDVNGNKVEVNANYYNVNSLYPYSMLNDFPDGMPTHTIYSGMLKDVGSIHGMVKAKVTIPTDINKTVFV